MSTGGNNGLFQDVSWQHPFGANASREHVAQQLGLADNPGAALTAGGVDKKTGQQMVGTTQRVGGGPGGDDTYNSNGLVDTGPPAYKAPSLSANNNFAGSFGGAPVHQNTAAESAFRDAYLKSLNPNTNFDINAQQTPNQFKAVTAGSVGPSNSVASPQGK